MVCGGVPEVHWETTALKNRKNLLSYLMALALALGMFAHPAWAADPLPSQNKTALIRVTIDYGNGVEKTFDSIAWRQGLTAWEATLEAVKKAPQLQVKHTGSGSSVFVTEIDGVANQGGGAKKKNWQYSVNDEYADVGPGAKVLKAGDRVVWRFAEASPNLKK
jgi:hypothetical protein